VGDVRRYARLFALQLRVSLQLAMQYRWDFLVEGLLAVIGVAVALVPLWVAFEDGRTVGGWRYHEALVVLGWFTLLKAILEGAINPSLLAVVDHIRTGTLDFVLLKPADAQFLVSTARFAPWRLLDGLAGLGIIAWAFAGLGRAPAPLDLLGAALLLGAAVFLLYSIWILVICAAFHVVRVDNLAFLLTAIFDAARWPATVFRGALRVVFTVVIPLALMTTYPAMAILGTLGPAVAGAAVAGSLAFGAFARWAWQRSIGKYTSASS
jgi:ABC-2 type transport system permease protein